jgi:hypothetical protein
MAGDELPVRRLRKDFAGSVDESAAGGGVALEAVEGVLETTGAQVGGIVQLELVS